MHDVTFELDHRIAAATAPLHETDLCLVRLMNDSRYPWLLVIPRRAEVAELFDLQPEERHALVDLAAQLADTMACAFAADKINIGALGNRVRQFHLHVIVRRTGDAAWPDAVWNGSAPIPYKDGELQAMVSRVRACLPPGTGS